MDIIKLGSKFSKGIVARLLAMLINKKFGSNMKVKIEDLEINNENDLITISLNANATMTKDELIKLIIGSCPED